MEHNRTKLAKKRRGWEIAMLSRGIRKEYARAKLAKKTKRLETARFPRGIRNGYSRRDAESLRKNPY